MVSVLAVIVLAVAGWLWLDRSSIAAPESELNAVPLTSYPGAERSPSFSPDGSQVAFCWSGPERDNYDIYVKMVGVGEPSRLTAHAAADVSPAWSPDGRFIAFLRIFGPGKADVLLVPPLGGVERKLKTVSIPAEAMSRWIRYLSWSPDARWLAFTHRDSPRRIPGLFLYSLATEETRQITEPRTPMGGDRAPAFSPDGRRIAFTRLRSFAQEDLYMLTLSENLQPQQEPIRLTSDMGWVNSPAWTADGRVIVFSGGSASSPRLWWMNASENDRPRRLAGVGDIASQPALSTDGERLAFTKASPIGFNIWRLEISASNTPAGPPVELIASTQVDADPRYSPDGSRIAFYSARSGNTEIWVCDRDGSNTVQLTSFGKGWLGSPSWSPDGRFIAFDSNAEGQYAIYVIESDGGAPRRLTDNPLSETRPVWSNDGKWIYFASNRTGESQIWKIPSGGGNPTQVTQNGGENPWESPTGQHIFYARGPRPYTVWTAPVDGGEETQFTSMKLHSPRFAVNAKGLYSVAEQEDDGRYPVLFFNFSTKTVKRVTTVERGDGPLSVTGDGRWLLYVEGYRGSDLMLVENFR